MPRRLLIAAALAAAGLPGVAAPLELGAELALNGWARPGRVAEVDVTLSAAAPMRATLEVQAGAHRSRAELELQPGRTQRLSVPVPATAPVLVSLSAPGVAPLRRELAPTPSESPLFVVALAAPAAATMEGFHGLALAGSALPRSTAAYASVDALLLDAATLTAMDPAQVNALLGHIAGCGRVVVLQADARVRGLLDGARGCGGQGLLHAATADEAVQRLQASLAEPQPAAVTRGSLGELARPSLADWDRVAVALALTLAVMALALLFTGHLAALLALPAAAALALLVLLNTAAPAPQLVIWSEGDSGARLARYQAWQRFPGSARGPVRVAIPAQLASGVQACDAALPVRLDYDAGRGLPAYAEFETRLFRQVWFCHAGAFPMERVFDTDMLAGGMRQVRNPGLVAWPAGTLIVGGQGQPLPALGPGGAARVPVSPPAPVDDPAVRVAASRLQPGAAAALWPLELGGVAGAPRDARGWLLVTAEGAAR